MPKVSGLNSKEFVESVFDKLRAQFPDDAQYLNFEFSAMSLWPDFNGISWFDTNITIPLHGVFGVHGISFLYTEDFCRFFPHPTFSAFNVVQACILPPYVNSAACNNMLRSLAVHMNVPSVENSCRDRCSVVAVLSCIDASTLDMDSACKMLPIVGPRLPEQLVCAMLDMYQEHVLQQQGAPGVLLNDAVTSSALLAALKRYLDMSAIAPRLVASAPTVTASTSSPLSIEIDAQDYVGKWYSNDFPHYTFVTSCACTKLSSSRVPSVPATAFVCISWCETNPPTAPNSNHLRAGMDAKMGRDHSQEQICNPHSPPQRMFGWTSGCGAARICRSNISTIRIHSQVIRNSIVHTIHTRVRARFPFDQDLCAEAAR